MANKTNKLIVGNINNTLYVIPYYQRGYRWTGKNVKHLLNDLLLFANAENDDNEYCLQPIVLQKISNEVYSHVAHEDDSVIRVVDGQQRLTTLAIILNKLSIPTTWDIYYDSEKKKLSEILDGFIKNNSINDYFRTEVSEAVDEFISNNEVKQALVNLFKSNEKRIAFLEYDIDTPTNEDAEKEGHKSFLRLNDGKTPLTSSELIRALYMVKSSGLSVQQQMEISKEWEIVENSLTNEQFWLMFNARGLEDTPTRIDLLFALVLQVSLRETKANPRIIFEKLDDDIHYNLETIWDEVLQTYWWMQSCYSDIELSNYLGWIRHFTDISATTIYNLWRKYPKHQDFKNCIIKTIQDTNFGGRKLLSLDDVSYAWDKGELRKLFVLLNILDCNKSNERFRFDLFDKCKGWDIEHIDSQTPNDFQQDKNKTEWLTSAWNELDKKQRDAFVKHFWESENVEIDKFDIASVSLDEFESYATFIVELTQDSTDKIKDTDKLGNLALLNLDINRSYKNDIFPLKRKAIIKKINSGTEFIPPCTVKAFTKFYTKSASRITSWQNADFEGYYNVMNSFFKSFMELKTELPKSCNETGNLFTAEDDYFAPEGQAQSHSGENDKQEVIRFDKSISFSTFMDSYDVIIPKIQRLYVQGRLDKRGEKCLSGFASALVNSVITSSPMLLDFVYGIDVNGRSKAIFYPLDGQQRLTTLLLLSWLCGFSSPNWKFRYESRRTTEVFIKGLLKSCPPPMIKPSNYDSLKKEAKEKKKDYPSLCKDYICSLAWFQSSWLSDPGICGMIEMMDSLYDKLLDKQGKSVVNMESIVFLLNYLDVSKYSYDHIFLKMNSRGRELTEWDNVNAILDEYLPTSLREYWPEKIQQWYELMWNKTPSTSSKDTDKINRVDSQMLGVVELALDCYDYRNKCTNTYELSKWFQDANNKNNIEKFYKTCGIFFSALELDATKDNLTFLIPSWTLSQKPRIPDFSCKEKDVVSKFYQPLLAYYASVKSRDVNWMRIVWNLVENIDIERQSFKQALRLIEELSVNKDSILAYLGNVAIDNIKSCYRKAEMQLQEEIDKSCQIVNHSESCPPDWNVDICGEWIGWQPLIIAAERKRCFAGAIRFLFHDENFEINWNSFFTKWNHANEYFDSKGIKDEYAAKLVSALLKRCSRWNQIHDNFIFDKYNWKHPVLLNTLYAEPLDYILSSQSLDVEVTDFENNLVCERIIRDRLFEDKLIKVITANYRDYRLSTGRYFYGWRKHDGILFDWRTNDKEANSWEHRRTLQVKEMQSSSSEITIRNKCVSEEIFFGYSLRFEYKNKNLEWPGNEDVIYIIDHNQRKPLITITPDMCGEYIIQKLDEMIK